MKLVVAVVHNEDARVLIDALLAREYRATWLHSSGGFLKQSNATVLLGVDDDKVEEVMGLVRENCHSRTQVVSPIPPIMEPGEFFLPYPLEVEVGGAVVFVLPMERFERIQDRIELSFLPDLVDVWVFRLPERVAERGARVPPEPEILLLRRSPGRILPGLWQCVSGSLEARETVPQGALRELVEETGIAGDRIEAFYDLDQVNQFYEPTVGAILSSAIFAVRVGPGVEPILSHEHDAMRWVTPAGAFELAVWPAYRESIRRIADNLLDPERAIWFELTLEGERARR